MIYRFIALLFAVSLTFVAGRAIADSNTLILELRTGEVTIEMRPDLAPNHVARIKELVQKGFYNGLKFHRVIPGFMAQTGDPSGDGTGGSGQNIKAEFTVTPFVRGVVGMARARDPDSADSQFFIMFEAAPSLNNQYTVWGQVVSGMEHVDRIKKGEPALNGVVQNPDTIVSLRLK
jgi:peptidylprolyl isomerase